MILLGCQVGGTMWVKGEYQESVASVRVELGISFVFALDFFCGNGDVMSNCI